MRIRVRVYVGARQLTCCKPLRYVVACGGGGFLWCANSLTVNGLCGVAHHSALLCCGGGEVIAVAFIVLHPASGVGLLALIGRDFWCFVTFGHGIRAGGSMFFFVCYRSDFQWFTWGHCTIL